MPHSTLGGGTETKLKEFDLQRFATVSNPYTISSLNDHFTITGKIIPPLVSLDSYVYNIPGRDSFTELPDDVVQYLSSGLTVSSCRFTFGFCGSLLSIPWNEFNINTEYCITMNQMFAACSNCITINLTGMNTKSVTNMSNMFRNCFDLEEIICPDGFDISSCTDIDYMLSGCTSYNGEPLHLKNVLRNLDFSNIGGTEGTHYVIDSYKD